jgi:hypothetical protein
VKAGGERRRLCLRKSALAGSWSCVSGYLPGACALSLLSGRAGLWAARALAALMGSVRARWQADGSRLPLRPHLPGHVPDMHACLRDVLLFLCVRFAPVVAAHCTARSSAAPSAPLFLLSRPPPLLAPLVPFSALGASVTSQCLGLLLALGSLAACRQGVLWGWVVPLSPSALSVGVGVADLSSRVSALSRCSCSDRARLRAHACLAACTVLQRRSRSPRSGGVAAPSRSCGAAALVPWRRSRSPVLRRRSRPHV